MSETLTDLVPWSLSGGLRAQRIYVASLSLLVIGTLLSLLALRWSRLDVLAVGAAGAGIGSWLLSSTPAEGRTLLVVLPGNGLTVADVAALPAMLLVAVLSWRRLRGLR